MTPFYAIHNRTTHVNEPRRRSHLGTNQRVFAYPHLDRPRHACAQVSRERQGSGDPLCCSVHQTSWVPGAKTAAILKQNPKTSRIPVVALTAWMSELWWEKASKVGIVSYLLKPISPQTLKQTIEKFTNGSLSPADNRPPRIYAAHFVASSSDSNPKTDNPKGLDLQTKLPRRSA
jgi:DNA-binding NarL/FixJ family response regulator